MKATSLPIQILVGLMILLWTNTILASSHGNNIVITISGNAAVVGQTTTYTANSSEPISDLSWRFDGTSGGQLSNQHAVSSTSFTVDVYWTSTGQTKLAVYNPSNEEISLATKTINPDMPPPPAAPTATLSGSVIKVCGGTTVTRVGNPPTGYDWFWVTDAGATSQNATSFTLTSSSNVYLRARRILFPNEWGGTESLGSIQVDQMPAVSASSTPASVFQGNPTTISVSTVATATGYKWYLQSTGGTAIPGAALNTYAFTASATTVYYVSVVSGTCETIGRKSVTATVEPLPAVTTIDGSPLIISLKKPITVTVSTHDSYSWRTVSNAVLSSAQTCAINTPGDYHLLITKTGFSGSGTVPFSVKNITDQNLNYIITNVLQAVTTDGSGVESLSVAEVAQSIEYYDGVGRPMQSVTTQGSPGRLDIVTPTVYDVVGRESRTLLPAVTGATGWYKPDILDASNNYAGPVANFYSNGSADKIADDTAPYADRMFESSPLNRVLKQGSPGAVWSPDGDAMSVADKTVKFRYELNASSDVMLFSYDATTGALLRNGNYAANKLAVKKTLDENNNQILEYTDLDGQMVCKKVQYKTDATSTSLYAATYYVYDIYKNLVAVLPPEAVKMILTP